MFNLGFPELLALGGLALLVIGPKQLPEVAKVVARTLNELKRATKDITGTIAQVKTEATSHVNKYVDEISQEVGNVEEDYHNIDDAHMDDDGIYGDHHAHDHADEDGQEASQTLVEHLSDLRKCLLRSIIAIVIGFGACWIFSDQLFDIIRQPIAPFLKEGGLIFTAPMDKFLAHIKVSLLASAILSCPFWIYQVWLFIAPGLYEKEKKYGIAFIFSGSFLFLLGVSFVYFVVYPMAFDFLMNFGGGVDAPMITISEYLSFFTTTTLVFGAAFEMPLVLTILGILGVIDHHFLASKRRYAIVIMAALSAFITPPDVISMFAMLVPLTLLYELSIFLVKVFGEKRNEESSDLESAE